MTLGIIGTGMIGASVGLRARRNGTRVLGCDKDDAALVEALDRGAIDERVTRDALLERSSCIVIAAPVEATCAELVRLRGSGAWELLVDVASVKRPIMKAAAGVHAFVATHPLAGNEGSGPGRAGAEIFQGRAWCFVSSGDEALDARACRLIESLGGCPVAVDAESHDAAVAVTSHLPQMVAWLLAERIAAGGELYERLCGPAGREFLRLGGSSPDLWREILRANADNVAPAGRALARDLLSACDGVDAPGGP